MARHEDLTQDMKIKAHELGRDAKDAIYAEAERATAQARDNAAQEVTNAANAAHAAGAEFEGDSLQARAAHQIAEQVEGIAAHLRSADLGSITRDVSQFARKNPALFVGGAALLGFAATRFLKARDPEPEEHASKAGDPWGSPRSTSSTTRGYDVPS